MIEQNHIAILDDVISSFRSRFAHFSSSHSCMVANHVVVGDHFGADEPFFEIRGSVNSRSIAFVTNDIRIRACLITAGVVAEIATCCLLSIRDCR